MVQDSPANSLNEALLKENMELRVENAHLQKRCREPEERVNKNSPNSSKPPWSDGYQKPGKNGDAESDISSDESSESSQDTPNPKSLRQSSGNKAGDQKGHQGHFLKRVDNPDYNKHLMVNQCCCCQSSLIDVEPVKYIERQVFEPGKPGEYEVTTNSADAKICSCGSRNQAKFLRV